MVTPMQVHGLKRGRVPNARVHVVEDPTSYAKRAYAMCERTINEYSKSVCSAMSTLK